MATQFDKDFGYLMPFLDRITAAAESLSDPAAREEANRLLAGEKERWMRVQALLGGAAGKPQRDLSRSLTGPGPHLAHRVEPAQLPSNTVLHNGRPVAPAAAPLTVGPLRGTR